MDQNQDRRRVFVNMAMNVLVRWQAVHICWKLWLWVLVSNIVTHCVTLIETHDVWLSVSLFLSYVIGMRRKEEVPHSSPWEAQLAVET